MISGMDSGLRSDVGDLGFHICRLLLHLQLLVGNAIFSASWIASLVSSLNISNEPDG